MYRDLEIYLQIIFAAGHDHTAVFRSVTSHVVETSSATLGQDVSSIFSHPDARLVAPASRHSVTASSNPLVLGESLPPSQEDCIAELYLNKLASLPLFSFLIDWRNNLLICPVALPFFEF